MSSLLLSSSNSSSRDYYWLIIRSFLLFALLTSGRAASDDSFNRVIQAGFNLQLPCTPHGSEEILNYFTWSKNDQDLNLDRTPSLFQSRFSIQNDFSLKIENITEEDEGTYTCNVWSEPARITSYNVQVEVPATIELPVARLTVTADRNVVISAEMETAQHHSDMNDDLNLIDDDVDPTEVYHLREGGDLDLTCRVKGQPLPIVTWKFQGKVLNAIETISPADERPNRTIVSVHRITNARRVDAGRYVCEADNGVDMPAKATFRVQVNYAPEIVVENNWVHAGLGSFTELVCIVHAQPPAHVTWFRSSTVANNYSSISTMTSSTTAVNRQVPISSASSSSRLGALALNTGLKHVLRFKNVRDADLGVYTCHARNQLGEKESTLEMSGIAAPAVLRVAPPREGNMLLNFDDDHDIDGNKRRHYQLIWDVVSYSPIYEYKLWLRPRESIKNKQPTSKQPQKAINRDRAPHTNIIVPSSSAPAGTFMHSHGYVLTDLAIGVVYKVTVQSRNRFGWSVESNAVFLSGGGSDDDDDELDYHEDQNHTSSSTSVTTTTQTTHQQSTSPIATTITTTTTTVTTSTVSSPETTTIKTPEKEQQVEVKPEDKPTSEAQQPGIPVTTPGNNSRQLISVSFGWLIVISLILQLTSNTRIVEF